MLALTIWVSVQFVQQNADPVAVDLLLAETRPASLWLVLLTSFGIGAAIAGGVCLFEVARYSLVARRYRKTVARLESEIHQLRNLPLADEALPTVAPPGGPAARGF